MELNENPVRVSFLFFDCLKPKVEVTHMFVLLLLLFWLVFRRRGFPACLNTWRKRQNKEKGVRRHLCWRKEEVVCLNESRRRRTDGWRDRDGWEVPTDPGRRLFGALNFEPFDREVRIAGRKKGGRKHSTQSPAASAQWCCPCRSIIPPSFLRTLCVCGWVPSLDGPNTCRVGLV